MITNGTVTIEDGTKAKEEYAPARKVSVTIVFSVPEGVTESAQSKIYLDTAASMANAKVNELLGRSGTARALVKVEPAKEPATSGAPAAETPTAGAPSGKKKPAKEPAKTKADLAKEAGLPTTDTVHKAPVQLDIEEDLNPPEDDLGDLIDAPAPITDAEIAKAAQMKNALQKQKDPNWQPQKLRDLITTYAGPAPKKLTDIPAAKRQEFLDKLKALE